MLSSQQRTSSPDIDPAPSRRYPGRAANAAATSLIAATAVAGVLVFGLVIVKVQAVVLALFAAIIVGEAARPLVDRLSILLPRALALAFTFAAIAAVVVLTWTIPIHALAPQAAALWYSLPAWFAGVVLIFQRILGADNGVSRGISELLPAFGGTIVPAARGLLSAEIGMVQIASTIVLVHSTIVVVQLMALFWLISSSDLKAFMLTLVQPTRRTDVDALFCEVGGKLGLYVSGSLINGSIVALLSMLLLTCFKAPYAIVLGLLQGLLVAIPYVGTVVSVLAVGSIVLAAQGWTRAGEAVLLISVMEGLEGSFVSPLIFKRRLDISPLSTILATAIGGALFGIGGVILAVPAAAVAQTVIVRLVAPAIRRFSHAE